MSEESVDKRKNPSPERIQQLQEARDNWRKKNPVLYTRTYVLENKAGDEIVVTYLKKWCLEEGRPGYANLLGCFKRGKGWSKGWRIKSKLEKGKPARN